MSSFIGDYVCKLDEKGRLLFPSGFKKQNEAASVDRFVVKKDIFENCLVLYSLEEWGRQNEFIKRQPTHTTRNTTDSCVSFTAVLLRFRSILAVDCLFQSVYSIW